MQQQDGESLSVSLCSPPNARIGRYSMTLETCTDYQGSSYQIGDFVLLFNPWHPGETFTSLSSGILRLRQTQDAGLNTVLSRNPHFASTSTQSLQ